MFIPVRIGLGTSGNQTPLYSRNIELTVRQLAAFEHEAGNMTVPLTRIGEDMHTQIAAAFASQGATGFSGPWEQLSDTYGTWKAERSAAPMLVGLRPLHKGTRQHPTRPETYAVSGKMMRQLLEPVIDHATWHISPRRLAYTPLSDIAGYHETGTDKMPPRPPVDLSLTFLHSIDRAFAVWLAGLMKKLGL